MPSVKICDGDRRIELESSSLSMSELLEMAAQALDRCGHNGSWSHVTTAGKSCGGVTDVGV